MDRERAEHHLRLIAETELRRTFTPPAHEYSLADLTAPRRGYAVRFVQVAQALIAVGAIERNTAETIRFDYDLAMTARLSQSAAEDQPLNPHSFRSSVARLVRTGPRQARSRQNGVSRATAVGMMIPLQAEDVRGELYVLAYSHTPAGARLTITAWLRGQSPNPPAIAAVLHGLTATDDKGNAYRLGYHGTGGLAEWAGELRLVPDPPPDISWLEITVGETVRRVPLDQQGPAPEITVVTAAHSPGERLLHGVAARVLASLPIYPKERRRRVAGFMPVLPEHLTNAMGDIIEALEVAGALSPLSLVPGQLRTLCESIGVTNHGITAPPRSDLPDPWLSLLTGFHRRRPDAAPPGEGCAAVAVTLPEIDGIRLSILGLHNGEDGTVIHVHAAGLPDMDAFPLLWIRDDDGRWHTTRRSVSGASDDGEISSRMEVIPPLNRGSRIEVLAVGSSAEVRASLPLRWR